ncbi:MAG: putative acetyltransferase EpsM [Nitrospirae bacterium]|nr:MAG: putative acetyltransferase EpsM [Nitrospira sp. OLB3]MBV6470835.1 putative acetyltransferase EpsM [Nitrospirota bacterium]
MKTLFIVGAGGLGKEVVDIVQSSSEAAEYALAFIDDTIAPGTIVHGIEVVGARAFLRAVDPEQSAVCVAIGSPAVRRDLIGEIEGWGLPLPAIVDASALIRPSVVLGPGVIVGARAFLSTQSVIGAHAVINPGVLLGHDVVIGPYAVIGGGAMLSGGAKVGEGALIGAGASVLLNTSVGDWATVGMGAAVYAAVENGVTVLGNPARALPVVRKKGEGAGTAPGTATNAAPAVP